MYRDKEFRTMMKSLPRPSYLTNSNVLFSFPELPLVSHNCVHSKRRGYITRKPKRETHFRYPFISPILDQIAECNQADKKLDCQTHLGGHVLQIVQHTWTGCEGVRTCTCCLVTRPRSPQHHRSPYRQPLRSGVTRFARQEGWFHKASFLPQQLIPQRHAHFATMLVMATNSV